MISWFSSLEKETIYYNIIYNMFIDSLILYNSILICWREKKYDSIIIRVFLKYIFLKAYIAISYNYFTNFILEQFWVKYVANLKYFINILYFSLNNNGFNKPNKPRIENKISLLRMLGCTRIIGNSLFHILRVFIHSKIHQIKKLNL